jgi:hypothetical protein
MIKFVKHSRQQQEDKLISVPHRSVFGRIDLLKQLKSWRGRVQLGAVLDVDHQLLAGAVSPMLMADVFKRFPGSDFETTKNIGIQAAYLEYLLNVCDPFCDHVKEVGFNVFKHDWGVGVVLRGQSDLLVPPGAIFEKLFFAVIALYRKPATRFGIMD